VTDGDVGRDRLRPVRPPFADKGGETARTVLVGAAEEGGIARAEIFLLKVDGGDELVASDLLRQLRAQRQPVAESAVQWRVASRLRLALSR
jgi:hypothetical protein